jgi:hypothetical protein
MFLLYHSEGCNICEFVLHECYVNDLHTTTCSGMLGHHTGVRGASAFGTQGAAAGARGAMAAAACEERRRQ